MPAGPTELLVVAERGDPGFIAADMIAQAEHDPDAMSRTCDDLKETGG